MRFSRTHHWGFWRTAGLGALILAVFVLIQVLVVFVFGDAILGEQPGITGEELATNGFVLAVATCATGVLCTLLILLVVQFRQGIGIRDYLGLRLLPWRSVLAWLGIGIVVVIAIDVTMLFAEQEIVPEVWINMYRTAGNLPLFWFALVIAAPLFEEFLFRGFLFSGWLDTRLRATGTILLTSAIWTLIHIQYDIVQLLVIFAYGIVLGLARYRTASLITPLVMHGAINLLALLQVTLLV